MSKFYCSKCGLELIHIRKAVPGKGHILDLIDPHECEGYAVKSSNIEKPTVLDVIESLKDLSKIVEKSSDRDNKRSAFDIGDRRSDKNKLTSSAPSNILNAVKAMEGGEDE